MVSPHRDYFAERKDDALEVNGYKGKVFRGQWL